MDALYAAIDEAFPMTSRFNTVAHNRGALKETAHRMYKADQAALVTQELRPSTDERENGF